MATTTTRYTVKCAAGCPYTSNRRQGDLDQLLKQSCPECGQPGLIQINFTEYQRRKGQTPPRPKPAHRKPARPRNPTKHYSDAIWKEALRHLVGRGKVTTKDLTAALEHGQSRVKAGRA